MTGKKEFNLKEVFTVWLKENTKQIKYLTGRTPDKMKVIGFYNTFKKNPKEPDIRIYEIDSNGNRVEKEFCSLWENYSNAGKKYISGKIGESKVVGFFRSGAEVNGKRPLFSVYYAEQQEEPTEFEGFEEYMDEDVPF